MTVNWIDASTMSDGPTGRQVVQSVSKSNDMVEILFNPQVVAIRCAEVVFQTQTELDDCEDWAGQTIGSIFWDYGIVTENEATNILKNWDNCAETIDTTVTDWNTFQRFYCVETATFGVAIVPPQDN